MRCNLAWFFGLCLLFVPLAAQAQKEGAAPARFGAKLGMTITTFGGDDADAIRFTEFENKLGFAVGVMAELALASVVSVQPEVSMVTKGAEIEVLDENIGYMSLRYLEMALLVRRKFPVGDSVVPFVVVGPSLGILLAAKTVENEGGSTDIEDGISGRDFGVVLGGGVAVPLSSGGAFEVEVRYQHGLVSLNDDPASDLDLENRAFLILGGYRF